MRYTYSVHEATTGETTSVVLDLPIKALSVQTLCDLYNKHDLVEGDSEFTPEHFEFYRGFVAEDAVSVGLGLDIIRLTRYMPATQMAVIEPFGHEPKLCMIDVM